MNSILNLIMLPSAFIELIPGEQYPKTTSLPIELLTKKQRFVFLSFIEINLKQRTFNKLPDI